MASLTRAIGGVDFAPQGSVKGELIGFIRIIISNEVNKNFLFYFRKKGD